MAAPNSEEAGTEAQRLASLKKYLEERIQALQQEVESLKAASELVDRELAQQSFKRGTGELLAPTPRPIAQPSPEERVVSLTYKGRVVGAAYVSPGTARIAPDEKLGLKVSTPPLESFLIRKVLDEMRDADTERAGKGEIRPDQILSYDVVERDGLLAEIVVNGYGGSERLNRILRAASWTFSVMSQK